MSSSEFVLYVNITSARSYCILRNCVRVSDLIKSPGDTCFELTRARRVTPSDTCPRSSSSASCSVSSSQHPSSSKRDLVTPEVSSGVRTRLQTRQSQGLFPTQVCSPTCHNRLMMMVMQVSRAGGQGGARSGPDMGRLARMSAGAPSGMCQ